jgi:hypothetical protein
VSYDHMVRACDAAGCSGWSNTVTGTAGSVRLTVSVSGGWRVTGSGINGPAPTVAPAALFRAATVGVVARTGGVRPQKVSSAFDPTGRAPHSATCSLTMKSNLTKANRARLQPQKQ